MFHKPYVGFSHRQSILSSRPITVLCLPNRLFPSDVPTKTLQPFCSFPYVSHTKTISSSLFDHPNGICGAYDHNIISVIIIIIIIIPAIHIRIYWRAAELHLSELIGRARRPDMQKIQIIGFFLENRLFWQLEVRLLLFTIPICV